MEINDEMCTQARCGYSQKFCDKIGLLFNIALTCTSIGLVTSGDICYKTGTLISDKNTCTNVFLSGIILMFITFIVWAITIISYMLDKCDDAVAKVNVVTNPVTRSRSNSAEMRTGNSKNGPRMGPKLSQKKKNNPIQVLVD
jgi:hypothetical protein